MNMQTKRAKQEPETARSVKNTPQILTDKMFTFPDGLPAFEEVRHFFFACKPETAPFIFMRAIEPSQLGFVCIDPFLICPHYKLNLSDADTALLDITTPEEVMVLSIVTPSTEVEQTTANLQSPLVINLRTCHGRQIILTDQNNPVRYFIWEELKRFTMEAPVLMPSEAGESRCSAA